MTRFEEYQQQQQKIASDFIASDAVQHDHELATWFEICEQYPKLKGTGTADNLAHACEVLAELRIEGERIERLDHSPGLLSHIFTVNAVNAEYGHPIFPWPSDIETRAMEAGHEQRAEYLEANSAEIDLVMEQIAEYWERLSAWAEDAETRHLDHETEREDAQDAPDFWSEYAEGHHNEEQERQRREKHQEAGKQVLELMKADPQKIAYRLATLELDHQTHAQTPVLRDMAYTQVLSLQRRARQFLGMPKNNARYLGMDTDGKHHFAGASEKRQTAATQDARAAVKTTSDVRRLHLAHCLTWNNKAHQDRLARTFGDANLAKMKAWAQKEKSAA